MDSDVPGPGETLREQNVRLASELEDSRRRERAARADAARGMQTIRRLESAADDADRAASSQQALIASLRSDIGVRGDALEQVSRRLEAAETELVDLRAARDALTPPLPVERPGLTVAATFEPASAHFSGDFYLVTDGPEDSVILAIGDVVGKGLTAAKRAAFTRTALVSVAPFSDDPCELLELVNTAIVERAGESAEFVTAACVSYRPRTRQLRWAYAGHPPALRLGSGEVLSSQRNGLPLGISDRVACSPDVMDLRPDDGIVLMTDGLLEAGVPDAYGEARASAMVKGYRGRSPAAIVEGLRESATEHAGGQLRDDLCLLAMQVR